MRTVFLLVAFSISCLLLLPRQGFSLGDCVECPCKEMKAWVPVDPKTSYDPRPTGMRKPDPNNKELTIPILHAPNPQQFGDLLATAPDPGNHKGQGVNYTLYKYTKAPVYDCNVKAGERGSSLVNVTFAQAADWDAYEIPVPGLVVQPEWTKCVVP